MRPQHNPRPRPCKPDTDAPRPVVWLVPSGQGGNYLSKLAALSRTLPPSGFHIVDIGHDDGCLIWTCGYCSCDPTLTVRPATDGAA